MYEAAKLMGHTAAHAIWSISDSGSFIPIMQISRKSGKIELIRLVCDTSDQAVSAAEMRINELIRGSDNEVDDVAFAYDAYFRIDGERFDAVILSARPMFSPSSRFSMAIPYRWESKDRFIIHKPKIMEWTGCEDFDQQRVIAMFFEGADSHEMGVKVWNHHLDQSR